MRAYVLTGETIQTTRDLGEVRAAAA